MINQQLDKFLKINLLIFIFFFSILFNNSCIITDKKKDNEKLQKQVVDIIYTCPMHPDVKQDKPGNCPICEMKLVPIKQSNKKIDNQNQHHNHQYQQTTSKNSQNDSLLELPLPVQIYTVKKIHISNTFKFIAYTEIDKSALYDLYFYNSTFYIEDTFNTYESQFIKKNQPLLKVKSFDIEQTKKELALSPQFDELIKEKIKFLRKYSFGILSSDHIVKAPFDCIIVRKYFNTGALVEPNQPIYTLCKNIWIIAEVPISYSNLVYEKKPVKIIFQNTYYQTYVDKILLEGNKDSKTLKVKLHTPPNFIKYINIPVELIFEEYKYVLAIPDSSVINQGNKMIVFKQISTNNFKPVRIKVGNLLWQEDQGYYEVLEGLKEGDKIAKDGYFLLDSETKIKGL